MIHTLLETRFNHTGKLIYMATSNQNIPSIRSLTPYYKDGAFYVISDINSSKIKQLKNNPNVAICGHFFNASAYVTLMGPLKLYPTLSQELTKACESWILLGNVNVDSDDTIILKIEIKKGYIFDDNNKRYEIDFS